MKNNRLQKRRYRFKEIPWFNGAYVLGAMMILLGCTKPKKENFKNIDPLGIPETIERVLDEKIPKWQQELNVPCVGIGLIEGGKIRLAKVYGEHILGQKAPQNTIFNVASITKSLVAVTTMKLVDRGEWNIDEPFFNYWIDSDVKDHPYHKKLTTRHSLNHTTGFKNWRWMESSGKLTFNFEPGTQYQYSGEGIEYLQHALEAKYKVGLDTLLDSLLFQPLGIEATLAWLKDKDTARFAHWYNHEGKEHGLEYKTVGVTGADDLLITVEGMAKFGIHVMNGAGISRELFAEMVRPQSKIHGNASMGLGWAVVDSLSNGGYLINHDGSDAGVRTSLILLPESKHGIIIFTNGDNGKVICNNIIRASMGLGDEITQKLYWSNEQPPVVEVSDSLLNEYIGNYKSNENQTISFIKKDNGLQFLGEGLPRLILYPNSDTSFFPLDFEIYFVFTRDEQGMVNGFQLEENGKVVMKGAKTNQNQLRI